MRLLFVTLIATLVLDQASKLIVVELMNLRSLGSIQILPPWLSFRMAWNQGINFGLFAGHGELARWLLIGVALAISAWVFTWARRERDRPVIQLSAGLLIGGAVGNVIDRLLWGAVADFLNMSCCGIANPYAFNVADVAIFIGAAGLIVFSGRSKTP
jgi:signal peptidase II